MSSRRVQKVAAAIREVVSMAILADLNDPRVRDVTVTYVEVSGDLRAAKIHVSIMGDDTRQELSVRGLQSAAGFLQAKIAEKIDLRYTPRLTFILDQGVKRSIEISRILKEVLPDPPAMEPSDLETADLETADLETADQEAADQEAAEPETAEPETAEPDDGTIHDDNDDQE